jgi:NADH:ubiquinone oxidoreductase subunit E
MAWIAENRQRYEPASDEPAFTAELQSFIRDNYFKRYPTKRACLLPALHAVQHKYNWIPPRALAEIATFLELAPAEVLDTASFYEEYWLKPRGDYLFQVCRSFACEMMSYCEPGKTCGTRELTDHLVGKLGIDVGETTPDGRYTLVELECLGACGTAPVMGVNEVLYENVTTETIDEILNTLPADAHDYKDPAVTWEDHAGH